MLDRLQRSVLLLGCLLSGATLATAGPDGQKPEDLARARLEIARKAYKRVEVAITAPATDAGKFPSSIRTSMNLEQLISWSRRWMEAERDTTGNRDDQVAAIEAHRARLKKWGDLCSEIAESGSDGDWSYAVDLFTFHRLEAEYWLAKAKEER